MSRAYQFWVPGEGIERAVITADIQRYLGADALVRPGKGAGDNEGQNGYWVTAHKALTRQMIQDLKADSQRWRQEAGQSHGMRGFEYQDSRTHAARQHYGPSPSVNFPQQEPSNPLTTQSPSYGKYAGYQAHPSLKDANIPDPTQTHYTASDGRKYPLSKNPGYGQNSYGPTPTSKSSGSSNPTPGYYVASDGRQYPVPKPPTQSQAPGSYISSDSLQYPLNEVPTPPVSQYPPAQENKSTARPGYYIASDGRQYPVNSQPTPPVSQNPPAQENKSTARPGYYIASDGRQYPVNSQPTPSVSQNPRRDSPAQETKPTSRPGYYIAFDGREYPLPQPAAQPQPTSQHPRRDSPSQDKNSTARPGYYLASDGREYPLPQQSGYGQPQTKYQSQSAAPKSSSPTSFTSGYYTASDGRQYPRSQPKQPNYGVHSPISETSSHGDAAMVDADSDEEDDRSPKLKRQGASRDYDMEM